MMTDSSPSDINVDIKSPYLDYSYLSYGEPEYISLRGIPRDRGRFELAFGQIGGGYLLGGAIGGLRGFLSGLRGTVKEQLTGHLRRTHVLNHMLKRGGAWAQTAGVLALLYSLAGVTLAAHRECDDDLNTIAAATAAGTVFRAPAGVKKAIIGGMLGFGVATSCCLWSLRKEVRGYIQQLSTPESTQYNLFGSSDPDEFIQDYTYDILDDIDTSDM